jgi:PhzF family phenazine biosynthesis protein
VPVARRASYALPVPHPRPTIRQAMNPYRYRIVNVFVDETPLSGNALAVFEDGSQLDDAQMQAIALQFNLSETTFLFPSAAATARVRIFAPSYEMPFAGHPTLGTAHVVRALGFRGDAITLEMRAGVIPVTARGDTWTLEAPPPRTRPPAAPKEALAATLGLEEAAILGPAMWVDTGSEQLLVPLASADAVNRCSPDPRLLATHATNGLGRMLVYVWARESDGRAVARCFFSKQGALTEDPGTGSACANLGGWLVATNAPLPAEIAIRQGEHTGRRCRLGLHVDASERIFVTGRVVEIARGEMVL